MVRQGPAAPAGFACTRRVGFREEFPASASANSAADAKRSAGSFSSAVSTAESTCGGTVRRCPVMSAGSLGHHLGDDRLRRGSGERRLAGQHLVGHAPERVDIGARRDLPLAHRLLGTHVVRGAEGHAGLGHPGAAGLAGRQRDTEVGHQRATVVQQDVLRLDVAVDHPVAVGVVERAGDLGRDPDGIVDRELLLAAQPVAQRFAFHERHHIVRGRSRPRPSRGAGGCGGAAGWRWS